MDMIRMSQAKMEAAASPSTLVSQPAFTRVVVHANFGDELGDIGRDLDRNLGATGRGVLIGIVSALGSALLVALILVIAYFFRYTSRGRILLDRIGRPGEYDDEQAFAKEEAQALEEMDDIQRAEYMRAKAFVQANPPESVQTDISLSQFLAIQEKGVSAWEFEPELEIANCFVEGRTEIEFFDSECSVQSNLPLPKQNEAYYWEAKIYDKPESTMLAIGLTTKPYPLFRLPGYHKTSVAYVSPGYRRFNQPFIPTAPYGPPINRGDVIGVGYRPRTGTVFFTRNGKRLDDITHTLKTQNLFPTVGATGPCTVHVNFGQAAFVFLEAHIKKWGLAPLTGSLAPPPPYGSEQGSILLEGGHHGIAEGQGWLSADPGGWASNAHVHARTRSASMRAARNQPTSPGPERSPTDISLNQLSLVDSIEGYETHDLDAGEGTSTSVPREMPSSYLVSHSRAGSSAAGAASSGQLLDLRQAASLGVEPPPPEYTSPVQELSDGLSNTGAADDNSPTPRPGSVIHKRSSSQGDRRVGQALGRQHLSGSQTRTGREPSSSIIDDEDERSDDDGETTGLMISNYGGRRHRSGEDSPPIPSYDVAVGSVPGDEAQTQSQHPPRSSSRQPYHD